MLLDELTALEHEAFQALIQERLAADESFRIFTDLLARTRGDRMVILSDLLGRNQGVWTMISFNRWVEEEY